MGAVNLKKVGVGWVIDDDSVAAALLIEGEDTGSAGGDGDRLRQRDCGILLDDELLDRICRNIKRQHRIDLGAAGDEKRQHFAAERDLGAAQLR